MKKITLEQLEQHFGLAQDCYNEEGKTWDLKVASDFAELTEGDIVSVCTTLEGIEKLNKELEENLCLDCKLEIICVDGIYMGIDAEVL